MINHSIGQLNTSTIQNSAARYALIRYALINVATCESQTPPCEDSDGTTMRRQYAVSECFNSVFGSLSSKISSEIVCQKVAGVILVRRTPQSVVPATHYRPFELQVMAVAFFKQQPRKLRRERQVIPS